jgi:hypothetical protein
LPAEASCREAARELDPAVELSWLTAAEVTTLPKDRVTPIIKRDA